MTSKSQIKKSIQEERHLIDWTLVYGKKLTLKETKENFKEIETYIGNYIKTTKVQSCTIKFYKNRNELKNNDIYKITTDLNKNEVVARTVSRVKPPPPPPPPPGPEDKFVFRIRIDNNEFELIKTKILNIEK